MKGIGLACKRKKNQLIFCLFNKNLQLYFSMNYSNFCDSSCLLFTSIYRKTFSNSLVTNHMITTNEINLEKKAYRQNKTCVGLL